MSYFSRLNKGKLYMKKMICLFAAMLAFVLPTAVSALDVEGFYVGALGGANFLEANKRNGVKAKFKTGYNAGGMIGYRWCTGLRLEGEASYRHNKVRNFKFGGVRYSPGGHCRSWSYMANVFYDFSDYYFWSVTPYVGAGIGYTNERVRVGSDTIGFRHDKNGFAWQVIGGLAYPICDVAELAVEYRFHKGRARKLYHHFAGATVRYFF
ncbi:Outer membrane family protein [Chlamydiales bacterium STE3]|nr:Outer membrane family protein [Chlamydiales bacterium STE3]